MWEDYEFTHNDTYPWNIMLLPGEGEIVYKTKRGVWKTKGIKKVILIDYGKSHLVYKNRHYGTIRPFESSSIRDLVTFIVSCSSTLLSRHCDQQSLSLIFKLISFLSKHERRYCPEIKTVRKLRDFTKMARKYTEMIYSDKGNLEKLEPIDLVKFLGKEIESEKPLDRRLIRIQLPENIFENPYELLDLIKQGKDLPKDPEVQTLRDLGLAISRSNNKKYSSQEIYSVIIENLKSPRK